MGYGPGGPGGRPMSPPPGDEEALPSNENLPTALEEVLAYKEYRVRELGHFGEVEGVENKHEPVAVDERREYEVVADENVPEKAKNKNFKKKKKKKKTKRHQPKDEDENEQEKNGKNIEE